MHRLGPEPTICRQDARSGRRWSMISMLTFSRYSVSKAGTEAAEWDKKTWPELQRLAEDVAEAGIHFQGTANRCPLLNHQGSGHIDIIIYNRDRDEGKTTRAWLTEMLSAEPWFKDVLPNVRSSNIRQRGRSVDRVKDDSSPSYPNINCRRGLTRVLPSLRSASTRPSTCLGSRANV